MFSGAAWHNKGRHMVSQQFHPSWALVWIATIRHPASLRPSIKRACTGMRRTVTMAAGEYPEHGGVSLFVDLQQKKDK
jgi:hypothetical protein